MGKAPGRKLKNPRGRSRVKKGGGPDWQLQQGFDPNVHIAKLPRGNGNWQRHILWTADWHWDNPKCDRDKLARTLDYARKLRAGVIVIGDLFCAMQGRYDKRANKNDLRPEHQVGDYFDALVGTAADWLEPWLENLVLFGIGNHETSVYQRCETDLISRLTQTLRFRGSTVKSGGYTGWVRFQGTYSDSNRSQLTCFYNHGTGGGGPVSKGLIEFARMREQFVADAYVLGHIHRSVSDTAIVQWLNKFHKVENRKVHCVRCGTFKDDYGTGFAGFPVEKGHGPRPMSAQLQTLTFRGERLFQEWREVDE